MAKMDLNPADEEIGGSPAMQSDRADADEASGSQPRMEASATPTEDGASPAVSWSRGRAGDATQQVRRTGSRKPQLH